LHGRKNALHADLIQGLEIPLGDDAPHDDQDISDSLFLQGFRHQPGGLDVRARQAADADHIHSFLQNRLGDHFRGVAEAGVNDLHPGVPQGHGHQLGPPVMTVQAYFGNENSYSGACFHRHTPFPNF
jgi:hypothetical protein